MDTTVEPQNDRERKIAKRAYEEAIYNAKTEIMNAPSVLQGQNEYAVPFVQRTFILKKIDQLI